MNSLELSYLIPDFFAKTKLEKAIALIEELISGRYSSFSNNRRFLLDYYGSVVLSLSEMEYKQLEFYIIQKLSHLINLREKRKISYSLFSELIRYSYKTNSNILSSYQEEVLTLIESNKDKYLFHLITLALTFDKLQFNIEHLDKFFMEQYLAISRMGTINVRHLMDYTTNLNVANKRKILGYLVSLKPFKNDDKIIENFIKHHQLQKLLLLI